MPDRPHKRQSETPHRDKTCKACGRAIEWRRKWERDWDVVKFCSDACRGRRPGEQDAELEAAILSLLAERGQGRTICPSEAARLVGGRAQRGAEKADAKEWESLMEPARAASRRLVAAGRIVITQKGRTVDPSTAKGPIRLKLA